jgi:hypothetical protein
MAMATLLDCRRSDVVLHARARPPPPVASASPRALPGTTPLEFEDAPSLRPASDQVRRRLAAANRPADTSEGASARFLGLGIWGREWGTKDASGLKDATKDDESSRAGRGLSFCRRGKIVHTEIQHHLVCLTVGPRRRRAQTVVYLKIP